MTGQERTIDVTTAEGDEAGEDAEVWVRDQVVDLAAAPESAPTTMHARLAEMRELRGPW